jgi:two-component system response regulator NreC
MRGQLNARVPVSRAVRPIRLILADDHAAVREALRLLINVQPDLEVIGEAADGQEAVDAAVALKPDVLLMDVSMPKLNGLQATAAVRRRAPDVKVLRAGASGYALKQSNSAELLTAIRTVAAGRIWLDPEVSSSLVGRFTRGHAVQRPPELSPRETEVMRLIAWGHANKEIASRLGLSVKTVEVHKANGMRKLGLTSRLALVRFALLRGWLQDS